MRNTSQASDHLLQFAHSYLIQKYEKLAVHTYNVWKTYIKGKNNGKGKGSIHANKNGFISWIFHGSGILFFKCIISFNVHSNTL